MVNWWAIERQRGDCSKYFLFEGSHRLEVGKEQFLRTYFYDVPKFEVDGISWIDEIRTSDQILRKALLEGFGNRCPYSGDELSDATLSVDHFIPRKLWGPNCILNYVPTNARGNTAKSSKYDPIYADWFLKNIREHHAPKVLAAYARLKKVSDGLTKRRRRIGSIVRRHELMGISILDELVPLLNEHSAFCNLRQSGFGYRADYYFQTAKHVEDLHGLIKTAGASILWFSESGELVPEDKSLSSWASMCQVLAAHHDSGLKRASVAYYGSMHEFPERSSADVLLKNTRERFLRAVHSILEIKPPPRNFQEDGCVAD